MLVSMNYRLHIIVILCLKIEITKNNFFFSGYFNYFIQRDIYKMIREYI